MKSIFTAALLVSAAFSLVACDNTPVQRVAIPSPSDPNAYVPQPEFKPLPPQYVDQGQPTAGPGVIQNENEFIQAYVDHRSPRIMVFVNRTMQGDANPNPTAEKYDEVGATASDYDMIEAAMVSYFDNSGKIEVHDSEAARSKLSREQVLRIENGDPQAARLLATEFQTDILVRLSASPTQQSSHGPAIRMVAKAINLTNDRILGEEYIDMTLPMSKSNINGYSRYLTERLMGDMVRKWSGATASDTVTLRVYKTATVDDAMKIRTWLQHTKGVSQVVTRGATGGSSTAYAAFAVTYAGAPEDLYADLKDAIGASTGIKAVDIQANTINLEVTGQLNLVTTTRKTDTTTTTETHTTEEKTIEPINPAPTEQH